MPAPLLKSELLERVEEAIRASGFSLLYEEDPSHHPFRIRIFENGTVFSIAVYIWSLTHGGGPARPRHEYRIQMTGVDFPLTVSRNFKTLLLGWHESLGVFAGFDVRRHRVSQSRSPSIQIYIETLQQAQQNVFAFQRKGNDEIAVAFSPDLFTEYVAQQESLHRFAGDANALRVLGRAVTEEVPVRTLETLPSERRRVVRSIAVKVRASDFRRRVLSAYEHHCAVCNLQLDNRGRAHYSSEIG